jgi:hypothetical protein
MKKLTFLVLSVVMLIALQGLGIAQEKKAVPRADTITLSRTKNKASKKGCPVTALVWYSSDSTLRFPNQPVYFFVVGNSSAAGSGVTNAQGKVSWIASFGTVIEARTSTGPNPTIVSNQFTCSNNPHNQ